jgi:hypothetical protein
MGEVARREAKEGAARNESAAKRQAVVAKAKEWSDEEVRHLEKALVKFPVVRIDSTPIGPPSV